MNILQLNSEGLNLTHKEIAQESVRVFERARLKIGSESNEALDMNSGLEPSIGAIKEMDDMIVASMISSGSVKKGDRINLGGETYATALEDYHNGNSLVRITTPINESGIFYKLSNWLKSLNLTG